ncbi:TPA: helix-turn-helix domain-containing protein [Stenotrophomonas maltophilia]|nr:helix-turn-helix domain-containing protein [Stenotrophomonas maltophilia]HEL4214027.1 helix-turn-helix domain-containing protein [Stenotrophomonas maltophilia]HEL4269973.1 helix-turn-helix domain-containing protein [Stenotrophomonas maltophilia]HEL4301144.1 helix-turn-helix domain-containing protein [Stenotrophomonas maltophilia]HEL4813981.1 helix-turn-helix domain-containing protein [Stenotrophomonas maltophilia]
MDILTYRKEKGLSQAAFAALLTEMGTPATQGLVSQWEKGTTAVRAERAVQIELATGGALSRYDLLPAVFAPAPLGAQGTQAADSKAHPKAQVTGLIDSRMSKRALRAKLGLSSDLHLAKVLHLPVEQVSGWADDDMVPALPQVMKLLGQAEQQEPAKPACEDPDADRIGLIEVA